MTKLVELAVPVIACSKTVDVLGCDTKTESLNTSVEKVVPDKLGRIELVEDSNVGTEVDAKLKLPVGLKDLVNGKEATVFPTDNDD